LILVYKLDFKYFSRNSKIFLKKCRTTNRLTGCLGESFFMLKDVKFSKATRVSAMLCEEE